MYFVSEDKAISDFYDELDESWVDEYEEYENDEIVFDEYIEETEYI